MRDLFQVVFELKKKEMDEAKQLMNKENRVRQQVAVYNEWILLECCSLSIVDGRLHIFGTSASEHKRSHF